VEQLTVIVDNNENLALFEIANQLLNLKSFFEAKAQYISYSALNNVYGRRAFEDYKNTLRFIISHELAHIYLKSKETTKMEQLCDCYGLALLKSSSLSNLGIFETLLIKSIEEGATRFWKPGLKNEELLERFNFLKKYKEPNQILDSNLCDSLFVK
jgi:hypothetical protein